MHFYAKTKMLQISLIMDSRRPVGKALEADPSTNYYISESDRFNTDFVAEDRARREEERLKKEAVRQKNLSEYLQREEHKRRTEEDLASKERARLESMQSKWQQGQKNSTSAAYDPISLDYDPTYQGDALREADYQREMRAEARKANIDSKMNSSYNPLTGETRTYARR
jgi:hypothetical protein